MMRHCKSTSGISAPIWSIWHVKEKQREYIRKGFLTHLNCKIAAIQPLRCDSMLGAPSMYAAERASI